MSADDFLETLACAFVGACVGLAIALVVYCGLLWLPVLFDALVSWGAARL